jgi:HSP90 family molecular chaperone
MTRLPFKGTIDSALLTQRLVELLPSYSFYAVDETSISIFREISANATDIPRILYFSNSNERSVEFKLLTHRFRTKGIFVEASKSFDNKLMLSGVHAATPRPFLLLENHAKNKEKIAEIHSNIHKLEDMMEVVTTFVGSVSSSMYFWDNV